MNSKIFVIGAGRLGTTLGNALQSEQFCIKHIYNHSGRNITDLQDHFPEALIWNELKIRSLNESDVFFLTVRDDILPKIIATLKNFHICWEKKIVIHTSGILTSSTLQSLADNGSSIASMHPMQTFSSRFTPPTIFHGVFLACEGSPAAMNYCKKIAKKLKADFFPITSTSKVPYHLAGTVAANLFLALINISDKLFEESGIIKNKRHKIIAALVQKVINNFRQKGTMSALTGPLGRGDMRTIQQHIKYIDQYHPEIRDIYQSLSKYILNEIISSETKTQYKIDSLFE